MYTSILNDEVHHSPGVLVAQGICWQSLLVAMDSCLHPKILVMFDQLLQLLLTNPMDELEDVPADATTMEIIVITGTLPFTLGFLLRPLCRLAGVHSTFNLRQHSNVALAFRQRFILGPRVIEELHVEDQVAGLTIIKLARTERLS